MPTLADIYSAINTAKRKTSDFIQNPGTSLEQMLGDANDRARNFNQLGRQSSDAMMGAIKSGQPMGQDPATQQLMDTMANAYNPAGMTAVKGFPTDYHAFGPLINEAYMALKKNPSLETSNAYKALMEARDNAPINNPNKIKANYVEPVEDSYKGQHAAPMKDSGAAGHDLTGIYPEDFYSFEGHKFYGDGADEARDRALHMQISSWKNRPSAMVTIYRAVPKDTPKGTKINVGDWITPDRRYAMEHGEGALNNNYRIIKKEVKARDIFTNGDSLYEWGYDPQLRQKK